MIKVCAWCGKEYESTSMKRKYCSELCSRLAHNQRSADCKKRREEASPKQKDIRKCVICGKEFESHNNAVTCSKECQYENSRRHSIEYYWSHKEKKMRKCIICGKEFEARGQLQVCGVECREIRDKQKAKAFYQARKEDFRSYKKAYNQKRKEEELIEIEPRELDGKVLHRAEMTVDEYNKAHGTNYSYGQYVHYVESKGVK